MQAASDELARRDASIIPRPRFKLGDRVTDGSGKMGTITHIYQFEEQYRFVIQRDDGTETITFDYELTTADG
jgi:hypothetical protein